MMNVNENDYCVANEPGQLEQQLPEKMPKRRGRRPQSTASSGEYPEGKRWTLCMESRRTRGRNAKNVKRNSRVSHCPGVGPLPCTRTNSKERDNTSASTACESTTGSLKKKKETSTHTHAYTYTYTHTKTKGKKPRALLNPECGHTRVGGGWDEQ